MNNVARESMADVQARFTMSGSFKQEVYHSSYPRSFQIGAISSDDEAHWFFSFETQTAAAAAAA